MQSLFEGSEETPGPLNTCTVHTRNLCTASFFCSHIHFLNCLACLSCLFVGVAGLGIIPGIVTKFDTSTGLKVPQIGWNSFSKVKACAFLDDINAAETVSYHPFDRYTVEDPDVRTHVTRTGVLRPLILCLGEREESRLGAGRH